MSDSDNTQDDAAMSPASTGSLAWIPASERLPELYQTVLAFWKDGGIHTSWVTRYGMWEAHFDDGGRDTVTDWMPLPAPPMDAE